MKSLVVLALLVLASNASFAQTKCTGLADGYEEITIDAKSVTVHGWDGDTKYNIDSSDDNVLFSKKGLLATVSEDKKSATIYLGTALVHSPKECTVKGKTKTCTNKSGTVKISDTKISLSTKKVRTEMSINDQTETFISAYDLDSASHYSMNGMAVSMTAKSVRSISGRQFSYDCE